MFIASYGVRHAFWTRATLIYYICLFNTDIVLPSKYVHATVGTPAITFTLICGFRSIWHFPFCGQQDPIIFISTSSAAICHQDWRKMGI